MDKTTEHVSVRLLEAREEAREENARKERLELDAELEIFVHFKKLQERSNKQSRDTRDAIVKSVDKRCFEELQNNHMFSVDVLTRSVQNLEGVGLNNV